MEVLLILVLAAILGLIPANIAQKKGYSFGLWWFYGWMLFIVAIIHVSLIPDKNALPVGVSAADELKKYHDLLGSGTITQAEFNAKKAQLLGLDSSEEQIPYLTDEQNGWLNYYFDQLNKGIITQEQFDAKKKQLLGL